MVNFILNDKWSEEEFSIFRYNLNTLRIDNKLQKNVFSKKIGVSNAFRKDQSKFKPETVSRVCEVFNVTFDWLSVDRRGKPTVTYKKPEEIIDSDIGPDQIDEYGKKYTDKKRIEARLTICEEILTCNNKKIREAFEKVIIHTLGDLKGIKIPPPITTTEIIPRHLQLSKDNGASVKINKVGVVICKKCGTTNQRSDDTNCHGCQNPLQPNM